MRVQTIERIVKEATFYNIDEVKVETELRLLCSLQITHWAESSGELYNLLEKEKSCLSKLIQA